jgi:hypothetical protein
MVVGSSHDMQVVAAAAASSLLACCCLLELSHLLSPRLAGKVYRHLTPGARIDWDSR